MRLETLAVSKLMERMVNNGASLEELKKVADYMVTAAVYDEMTVNLYDVAEKNGIKELVKKYPPRFSWLGSSDTSAKELLNLNHGVPKHEYDFSKTKVGDKITVDLKELGKFKATAHEVTDNNVLFIFDNYIAERPMNKKPTNEGGYEKSDLKKWIDSYLYNSFPLELKTRMLELTIPTVGQVVGWENEWDKEHFEANDDEQLPLMKLIKIEWHILIINVNGAGCEMQQRKNILRLTLPLWPPAAVRVAATLRTIMGFVRISD